MTGAEEKRIGEYEGPNLRFGPFLLTSLEFVVISCWPLVNEPFGESEDHVRMPTLKETMVTLFTCALAYEYVSMHISEPRSLFIVAGEKYDRWINQPPTTLPEWKVWCIGKKHGVIATNDKGDPIGCNYPVSK